MSVQPDTEAAQSAPAAQREGRGGEDRAAWLEVDWREHQRWVAVDGQPVNVVELGPGTAPGGGSAAAGAASQTIVFIHGLAGSWTNWLEQLPVLAAGHRVIALDLPGFGHSPMPSEEISISRYARLLDRLLEELQVDAAAVVGNSMGGFIGAELAIAFPQRVERLVLVSAAGISTYNDPRTTRALPTLRHLERVLEASASWVASKSDAFALRRRLRQVAMTVVVAHPSRLPAALAAEQMRGAGRPGFLQALESLAGYDVRDRLPEIACPTLIVWGEKDRLISVRDADVFEQLIPNSRKVVFADTGHVAMLERPADFNALLESFLAE
ncbi:MAG: alpha/beta hydrolase fold protein [Solirubrobacterales bacterium]|nr:alpha/beta hydrolase fold protein [Solirubrobacterales bacterium]